MGMRAGAFPIEERSTFERAETTQLLQYFNLVFRLLKGKGRYRKDSHIVLSLLNLQKRSLDDDS